MAHTNWLRHTRVRGTDWHPCWAHVQQMSHGPSPASSSLHPATRRTMKILVPVRAKPFAHTPGHMVVRLWLSIDGTRLGPQFPMQASPDQWPRHTEDEPRPSQATHCRYT